MANEKRLIYADDALAAEFTIEEDGAIGYVVDSEVIRRLPAVDAAEVVHGRWVDVTETSLYVPDMKYTVTHTAETCSVCKVRIGFVGSKQYLYDNICPNCGAKN